MVVYFTAGRTGHIQRTQRGNSRRHTAEGRQPDPDDHTILFIEHSHKLGVRRAAILAGQPETRRRHKGPRGRLVTDRVFPQRAVS